MVALEVEMCGNSENTEEVRSVSGGERRVVVKK